MMTDSALSVSLLSLPRQIGSTVHCDRVWSVPDDLGTPSMAVPPGTELELSLDLTSVDSGVLVSLATSVDLEGECVRCLDPVRVHHEVSARELYFDALPSGEDVWADDVLLIGPHDVIDVEPLLRDSIVPLVEDRPLCRADCRGLCPGCGVKRDELPDDHCHELIDPRLAALAALLPDDMRIEGE